MRDVAAASELLMPSDARLMRCFPVSTRINHLANGDEGCSAPVELAQIQNRFFSRRSTLPGVRCRNVRLHIGVVIGSDLPFAFVLHYDL